MAVSEKLFNPKNRREQVEGVVEYYHDQFPLFTSYPSNGHSPSSLLYYTEIIKLAAYMFSTRDVAGYRYEVIQRYMHDVAHQQYNDDDPAVDV